MTTPPVSSTANTSPDRRLSPAHIASTVLGLVFVVFGLLLAWRAARGPHNDKELFLWVGLSVLGALVASPQAMGAALGALAGAVKPLLPSFGHSAS